MELRTQSTWRDFGLLQQAGTLGKPVDTICHYNAIILYSRVSYHANMINIGP